MEIRLDVGIPKVSFGSGKAGNLCLEPPCQTGYMQT
jgi:hypothetical protein